jgi:hypothetical protein
MTQTIKLLLALSWISMLRSSAQANPELDVSLRGGLTAATHGGELRAHRYGISGGVGASLQWELEGRFLLGGQVDLLYTTRGSELVSDGFKQATFEEPYFDVALAVRPGMRLGRADVYLLVGGSLNFLWWVRSDSVSGSSQDFTDVFRRVDVALLGGAGVAFHLLPEGWGPFRRGTVLFEARYDHGLLDTVAVEGELKNRTTSFMLGISFALGSRAAEPPPLRSVPPSSAATITLSRTPPVRSDPPPAAAMVRPIE